uniref:Retrotransposon Copia-like N-terminal domain-containing protein n=1 Tax=Vitis vinifera TaxID=29760 RepID=A5B7T9_VITVI|nr:hypothetical protein VITISV_004593 [Vitis vinifera]
MSENSTASQPAPIKISETQSTHTSHLVQITTIHLNGDNFLHWSQSVPMYIQGQGKIGYLTEDKKAPGKEYLTYATWDAKKSMVMMWLVNSMDEDISSNYLCYPTAKELWDNINLMYSDLGNQSQIFELTLKLGEIRQGNDSVTKYFNSLKRLWQDLNLYNDYEWKSPENCNQHKKTMEDNRIYKFLVGLNVEFDEVQGRIIGRSPLPSISNVFSEVRREENIAANKASNYQHRMDEKPRVWCDHYNQPRHTQETCWKIHGKPANWKNKKLEGRTSRVTPSANEADHGTFNKKQMDHLQKLLKSNSSSGIPSVSLAQTRLELEEDDW